MQSKAIKFLDHVTGDNNQSINFAIIGRQDSGKTHMMIHDMLEEDDFINQFKYVTIVTPEVSRTGKKGKALENLVDTLTSRKIYTRIISENLCRFNDRFIQDLKAREDMDYEERCKNKGLWIIDDCQYE